MSFLGVCALFHLFQVLVSQSILSQSPPVQILPVGSRIKLSCHIQVSGTNLVYWYRQREMSGTKLVCTMSKHAPAAGRFYRGISDEEAKHFLIIADSRRNDSGKYCCAVRHYTVRGLIFGNGFTSVITAGSPTIFLLTPPLDEIPARERVPLLCLVRGVSPDSFPVHWNVSGRDTGGQTDSGTLEPNGTHTVRSYISLSAETWSSGARCTCAVQINSGDHLLSESFSAQRDSPLPNNCIFLLSRALTMATLLLLGLVLVAARRGFRNRQRGTMNSGEEQTGSREHKQNQEITFHPRTLEARLDFNEDPTL